MLIEKSVLTPGPNRGEIDALLYGELGTILNWTERQAIGKVAKTKTSERDLTGLSLSVVAGAGFHLYLRSSQLHYNRLRSLPAGDRKDLFHATA